uniref:ribosomal protein S13 n=1 Tax=Dictyotopsis propagulifera TaxID=670095 RepID=UPI002E7A0173|nr:ribosomal protein S13 [Dictyotopsis propagulifera]WBP69955.1 ribosomal protein S13 [Dictyotopsis propagulifera]
MSYIVGTYIFPQKAILFSLCKIYGINLSKSKAFCKKIGLGLDCKSSDLTIFQVKRLENLIESSSILLNDDLRRFNKEKIYRLYSILSYRGLRHRKGLPVRGQRTHTNSKRRPVIIK